jgi:hypothetical protein
MSIFPTTSPLNSRCSSRFKVLIRNRKNRVVFNALRKTLKCPLHTAFEHLDTFPWPPRQKEDVKVLKLVVSRAHARARRGQNGAIDSSTQALLCFLLPIRRRPGRLGGLLR